MLQSNMNAMLLGTQIMHACSQTNTADRLRPCRDFTEEFALQRGLSPHLSSWEGMPQL